MKKSLALLVFLAIIFTFSAALATDWYVDNTASGSNNGTSWTNAWESFADITWGTGGVTAGDTLYISGGSSSKIYGDTLTIGASGTSGNVIYIKPGAASSSPSGHNGIVTITSANGNGILSYKQYITINGNDGAWNRKIRLTGNYKSGILIGNASKGVTLTYLTIDTNAPGGATVADREGIRIGNLYDYDADLRVEVSYCDIYNNYQDQISISGQSVGSYFDTVLIHHNDIHELNDDGIEMGYISGVSVYNNNFYGWGDSGGAGHPDMLVSNGGCYLKWYNNYFYGWEDDTHTLSSNILPSGQTSAVAREVTDVWVYNNFIYNTDLTPLGGASVARGIELTSGPGSSVTAMRRFYVFNNTIINQPFYAMSVALNSTLTAEDILVENNIITGCGISTDKAMLISVGTHTVGSVGDSAEVTIDYNLFYAGDAGKTAIAYGSLYAYADFKTASGCQDHDAGSPIDPKINSNGTLQPDSPARENGIDLSAYFTTDKDGVSRPQSSEWDIGAYEYYSESTPPSGSAGGIQTWSTGSVTFSGGAGSGSITITPMEK